MVILGVSYNQPTFCPNATWDPLGITLANGSLIGSSPSTAFVDLNNTIYIATPSLQQAQVWYAGSSTPSQTFPTGSNAPNSIFATTSGDVFVDNGIRGHSVNRWTRNSILPITVMFVSGSCWNLFVDIHDQLYCSQTAQSRVIRNSLWGNINRTETVAGNGTNGSTANMLSQPRGVFVDLSMTVYVADCYNDRVQMFPAGERNATTIAGTGAIETIDLNQPVGIVMDGSGYLFIADTANNRIVGSGPNGFRCVVGCDAGTSPLNHPRTVHFDSGGNLVVMDAGNNRIQKFFLISNSCGKRSHSY